MYAKEHQEGAVPITGGATQKFSVYSDMEDDTVPSKDKNRNHPDVLLVNGREIG